MAGQGAGSFWDAVRSWADSAGLTVAAAKGESSEHRPAVPESVCANCPICQGAATLEQINPALIDDLTSLAHSLLGGIGSALAAAAEQRHRLTEPDPDPKGDGPGSGHRGWTSAPASVPLTPTVDAHPETAEPGVAQPLTAPEARSSVESIGDSAAPAA